jgi:hypothetical protein
MVAAGTASTASTASVNPMTAIIASMMATETTVDPLTIAREDPLSVARADFAAGMGDTDIMQAGFANTYAAMLNKLMPEGWYAIKPASDKSDDGKKVRREQKACYAALNACKHSNPSVAWSRVCKAAIKLAVGALSAEEKAEEEEKAAASKKTMYQRVQAALASIVTKLGDADADHKKEIDALAVIIKSLPIK